MQRVVNDYYVVMKHRWDSGERLQPNVGSYRAFSFEVSVLAMALFTQRSRTTRILQSPITLSGAKNGINVTCSTDQNEITNRGRIRLEERRTNGRTMATKDRQRAGQI